MANTKSSGKKTPPKDVDAYLKLVPSETIAALQSLRKMIRAAAPDAQEIISYGVPTYRYQGPLVSFCATPKHCAFYVMSPGPISARKKELANYDTASSAIRFQPGNPLPETLVRAIVKDRIVENKAKK